MILRASILTVYVATMWAQAPIRGIPAADLAAQF